jgi:hypothetical protein
MVQPAWETVAIQVDDATTVGQLKHQAVKAALKTARDEQSYVVKFRGAQLFDESVSLGTLGARPNVPFIVLPGRRQPVR